MEISLTSEAVSLPRLCRSVWGIPTSGLFDGMEVSEGGERFTLIGERELSRSDIVGQAAWTQRMRYPKRTARAYPAWLC